LARTQARRQQRERLAGIALAVLGVAVLIIALFALREPNGHVDSPARTTGAAKNTTPSQQPASGARSDSQRASSSALSSASASASSSSASAPTASNSAPDAVKQVPLVVYNDTTTQGLAHDAAQRFENGGWTVTRYENLPAGITDIISTCAYYDPADPTAKPAAEALRRQYPTIRRVKPKFPELLSGPVVVVLTPDYSAA
jgi:hypothetical protein